MPKSDSEVSLHLATYGYNIDPDSEWSGLRRIPETPEMTEAFDWQGVNAFRPAHHHDNLNLQAGPWKTCMRGIVEVAKKAQSCLDFRGPRDEEVYIPREDDKFVYLATEGAGPLRKKFQGARIMTAPTGGQGLDLLRLNPYSVYVQKEMLTYLHEVLIEYYFS
jgi:hypothetical protein